MISRVFTTTIKTDNTTRRFKWRNVIACNGIPDTNGCKHSFLLTSKYNHKYHCHKTSIIVFLIPNCIHNRRVAGRKQCGGEYVLRYEDTIWFLQNSSMVSNVVTKNHINNHVLYYYQIITKKQMGNITTIILSSYNSPFLASVAIVYCFTLIITTGV